MTPVPASRCITVPQGWRAIDFIADLHLSASTPRTFEAWAAHLHATDADAVYILGDLFAAWVGDDMRTLPFERRCADVLLAASTHRQIGFMVGNRDFLLGPEMRAASGMIELTDPTLLEGWGHRVLLSHGDALCLDDKPYQAFRLECRTDRWQQEFLSHSLADRMRRVAAVRTQADQARRSHDVDAAMWADVDAAEARRWLAAACASTLVHGHTHRPADQALGEGCTRHVLSDWDLDHAQPGRAEVMRLTRDGLSRRPPSTES